jgi:hypothetical protein
VPDGRLARAIFVTTLAFYLLTSGREPPWGDANVQYMAAESMLRRGAIDIPKAWPDDLAPDADGKFYSVYPLLTSAVQLPGLALYEAGVAASPPARGLLKPLTSHLACSAFGALTCVLFFYLCRQRRLSRHAASVATAVLAFGTSVWVYAHYSYSEAAQTAMFTGLVLFTLRLDEEPTPRNARWFGLFAGLLFSTKYIFAPGIAGAVVFLAWRHRAAWRDRLRLVPHAALTAAPWLIAALVYNYLCWGSPTGTGYAAYFDSLFHENPLWRLWGMFLSPGKSLFLYSPPLVLGLVAIPALRRAHGAACLAVLAIGVPVLLVYSRYFSNGDWAWGPRFAIFIVPGLALGFAVLIDAWLARPTRLRRAVLAVVIALGVAVQLLGTAFYWDHFIRIATEVRQQWLGKPNRKGAVIPQRADGKCDSCFEDVHQMEWLPPFQPIAGHWWLVRSLVAGDDAKAAEARAPWHRQTSIAFDISRLYPNVRVDWWGLLWIKDFPKTRALGAVLLVLMVAATALGVWLWIRAHRASRARDDEPTAPAEPGPAAGPPTAVAPTE